MIECVDCGRKFFGHECFANHKRVGAYKKNNKKVCDIVRMCQNCMRIVNVYLSKHECGIGFCRHCQKSHAINDVCFMQPVIAKPNKKKYLYIFYDFETRQDTPYGESARVHVPNLCVAHQVCTDCIDIDDMRIVCTTCGVREFVFNRDPVKQLLALCVREKTDFAEIVCIAHNARAFDSQFILKELSENPQCSSPSVILNGHNITLLKYGRTKFIDSINYFQLKLSALPATFGLPESAKKGYFPHFFNTLENEHYIGPLPAVEFYGPGTMSVGERAAFLEWHENTSPNYVFDFQKEIVEYCKMDVEILRRACIRFREIFIEVAQTDPFVAACTIASTCLYVFKKNFLQVNTIGLIPPNGYRRADNHSQKSIEWLLYCELEIGREIIHAGRAREFRLLEGEHVDGYLPNVGEPALTAKGVVFEFQGCYVHGCPRCFADNRNGRKNKYGQTYAQAYENTLAKVARMRRYGYTVREMWECDFARMKRQQTEIAQYLDTHPVMSKITLNPRDAFFGGRTENIVTSRSVAQDEEIKYTDICSLYPYICKRGRYPIGHPRIYIGRECDALTDGQNSDLSRVEGLVKCKVLPPRNLLLPVLPVKMHGRLIFGLCRTCCEELRQNDCNHEQIGEREFTGTWVVDELQKAVELGYCVTEIFIIWQYEITQFDPRTGEGGLFAGYVNTFLRLKQQASGWPAECTDDESRKRYIEEYERDEEISLDREKIKKNPGLRSVAKLCLNSLWGKFGQRSNMKQTLIVKTREQLLKLLTAPEKEVFDILMVNETLLYANWRFREDAVDISENTNVAIAAYTTAQARLELYSYIEKLTAARVLYMDTDSCIFICKKNDSTEYTPPLGTLLGSMTDELKSYGEGTYITSFLSGGPKFYGFQAVIPSTGETVECCKVKGISLNSNNSRIINFESVARLIESYFENDREAIVLKYDAIRRTRTHDVITRTEKKSCSIVLKKRRYFRNAVSLPFGYKSDS